MFNFKNMVTSQVIYVYIGLESTEGVFY